MNKLNKSRQKMYLDGEVGIINDGTVEQLREVTGIPHYDGTSKTYREGAYGVQYHPISWFYENETELPKMVKYMGTEYDVVCKQDPYYRLSCGVVKQDDCTPINETNNELPKVGEWWECVENVSIDGSKIFTSGKKYKCEDEGYLTNNNKKRTLIAGCNDYRSHFIKSTQPTPTSYKLNIDIPEWVLKSGDDIEPGRLPRSIMEYIATPIYTQPYTLSNGQVIILTDEDIVNIKKMKS